MIAVTSPARVGSTAAATARRADEPADHRWDLLLVCIAAYILTSIGRVHQLFPVLQLLRPAILSGLLALGVSMADSRPIRRWGLVAAPTTRYLLALLLWIGLGIPFALSGGTSLDLFSDFVKTVLMYFVVAAAVRGIRDVERLAFVYLLAAAVYSAVIVLCFDLGSGDAWRLARLYYYDANDFATFVVTALPFGLYFLRPGRPARVRIVAAVSLFVLMVGFVHSGSRGGFIALLAVGIYLVVRFTAVPLRWRVGGLVLVALIVLGAASERYWKQMGTIASENDYNLTEETGRLQIWDRGVGYMLSHPIFGVGGNNFGMAEGTLSSFATRQQYGIGVRWNAPHNSYVQAGAELGIPGLALFVTVIVSTLAGLARLGRRVTPSAAAPPGRELSQALFAAVLGFAVGAFFLSLAYCDILYTLAALAVGLGKVTGAGRAS